MRIYLLTPGFKYLCNWYFISRESAKEYYEKARNTEKLVKCYHMLEDYDALQTTATALPDKHPLLTQIGEIFVSVGMCSQAVTTYVKVSLMVLM